MISEKNILSLTGQDYKTILDEMMSVKSVLMPEYTDNTDTDFGNLLITLCAMLFDVLSNKLDYSVNEAIPMLSETIKAMYRHCKWIGYKPQSNRASSCTLEITIRNDGETQFVTQGSQITMPYQVNGSYVIFEITDNIECKAPVGCGIDELYKIQCQCKQGETVHQELGVSNGKEDQVFLLTYYPYVEDSIQVEVKFADGHSEFYLQNENNSFVGSGKNSRHISLVQIDSSVIEVHFGDGINGKIPENNTEIIAHYRIGGGAIGNRPIGVINTPLFDMPDNFISIENITEAIGGIDSENVDSIKNTVEKGKHKTIYSLMRLTDFNNFLGKHKRSDYIEKYRVCKDTEDPEKLFRPIAIYIKPRGSWNMTQDFKTNLLKEMEEYRLIDDKYNLYDVSPISVKVKINAKSDGLTIDSQLKNAIVYAIKDYIDGLEIGDDDAILETMVGLYADDIRNVVRGVEGVQRFLSMDILDLKKPTDVIQSKTKITDNVYDLVLKRGQVFNVENIETDIIVDVVRG